MIDLPRSGPCRSHECRRRAVRHGLCPDHWAALWGDRPAPYPEDLEPLKGWREQRHRPLYGTAPREC